MTDTPETKNDHQVPAPAEHAAVWPGENPVAYTARSEWIVLRKKEKPVAEIFSTAYVADDGGEDRPVTFVFNGGPGAASAYLHMGAVGPRRIDFPPDGTLPTPPARLVDNAESWLAFTDLVFVDPVGTGFSRAVEAEKDDKDTKPDEKHDPAAFFGLKRDLESLGEFMSRWLSNQNRWGSPVFIAGESYGGFRAAKLARLLPESYGIGLSGAVLISPALEFAPLNPSDYDTLPWIDKLPTMAAAAVFHGRSRAFEVGTPLEDVLAAAEQFATSQYVAYLT
ncbi:MAG: S10 family serine carboxypeptidase-like protein, partial [Acidimicrobiia bacterium]